MHELPEGKQEFAEIYSRNSIIYANPSHQKTRKSVHKEVEIKIDRRFSSQKRDNLDFKDQTFAGSLEDVLSISAQSRLMQ